MLPLVSNLFLSIPLSRLLSIYLSTFLSISFVFLLSFFLPSLHLIVFLPISFFLTFYFYISNIFQLLYLSHCYSPSHSTYTSYLTPFSPSLLLEVSIFFFSLFLLTSSRPLSVYLSTSPTFLPPLPPPPSHHRSCECINILHTKMCPFTFTVNCQHVLTNIFV